ncbi:type II toxin-antitoxin system HicA family toxin [Dyadobacter pollutisoli]|jgi:predicted RNA binding protein YcfA (HicA-like mRNA interferase family)|uniref:Type II toxin-antitoxin system HicA family toxin n=1 Tax=Dyadobacter pollutisoli TaxID=2910158 RepID=A0A9E8SJ01_9BACT|nr:type II toxin-antitoxin system HicA family toxin [Dyadobacter pollutisoli]WAC09659.1 type II toxin-antitoxin system HicA family toxin [Dyadobacter pollutisoli]
MKSSELLRLVKKSGWVEIRQTGSHKIFQNPETGETIPVPFHGAKGLASSILKKVVGK